MRREARIAVQMRIDYRNVKTLRGFALDLVIVDDCAGTRGNLGHGIREIDGIVRTDEGLQDGELGTLAGDNQVSRIARPRLAATHRDKHKVNWLLDCDSTRNFYVGAIREECRIPGSERV